eukprot:6212280-Pleurochrysis_carterae.AAC.3
MMHGTSGGRYDIHDQSSDGGTYQQRGRGWDRRGRGADRGASGRFAGGGEVRTSSKGGTGRSGGWGGKGGNRGRGGKPIWRQFVDPSDDPEVVDWCRQRIRSFLDSGASQEEVQWLPNAYRNTIRVMAPKMGVGWLKQGRVNVLVRASGGSSEAGDAELRVRLVRAVAAVCDSHGGRITARKAFGALPSELAAFAQSRLGLKTLAALPEACGAECEAAQLRTRGKLLLCGEADDPFDAAIRVEFDRDAVREVRRVATARGAPTVATRAVLRLR